jgi:addiction module RelB/DinJ family antitoxin
MKEPETTLLRTRVNKHKLRQAEDVFSTLGIKPSDAVNMFLAQVALRKDMPFKVTTQPERLQDDPAQAKAWNDALGEY